MIWNKQAECMPTKELKSLQFERLRETVRLAGENVPHYKKQFTEMKLKPSSVGSLNDITKLPFTTKTDLRDGFPYGMFAVPQSEIVEIHTSSGTTGKPIVVGYTRSDIDLWG